MPKSPLRPVPLIVAGVAVAALVAGVAVGRLTGPGPGAGPAPEVEGLLWPDPKPLGPFALSDQHGDAFDLERLRGRWTLLSFGFTHCPDVCPTTLAAVDAADEALRERERAEGMQYVFVSVDPERDTLDRLGEYVAHFDERFLGVTGPAPDLEALTGQLGVVAIKGEPDADGDYSVDHSAQLMLIDPQGRLVGLFGYPHEPQSVARRVARIRDFIGS